MSATGFLPDFQGCDARGEGEGGLLGEGSECAIAGKKRTTGRGKTGNGVAPRAHSTNGGDQIIPVWSGPTSFCVAVVRQVAAGVHAALLASHLHATISHLHGTFCTFFILFYFILFYYYCSYMYKKIIFPLFPLYVQLSLTDILTKSIKYACKTFGNKTRARNLCAARFEWKITKRIMPYSIFSPILNCSSFFS